MNLHSRERIEAPRKRGVASAADEPLVNDRRRPCEAERLVPFRSHGELRRHHVAVAFLETLQNRASTFHEDELAGDAEPGGEGVRHLAILDVRRAGALEIVFRERRHQKPERAPLQDLAEIASSHVQDPATSPLRESSERASDRVESTTAATPSLLRTKMERLIARSRSTPPPR